MSRKFTCRGPAARNELERAMCLKAIDELEAGKNVDIWRSRIIAIYQIKQMQRPNDRFGGNMDGQWRTIEEIIAEYGTDGVIRCWEMWKNERKGCGQVLDETIKRMEYDNVFLESHFGMEVESPSMTYRICPKCGDADCIVLGWTNWD